MIALVGQVDISGLRADVVRDLSGMASEFHKITGRALRVTSAFRSLSKQAELYKRDPAKAAAPGRSMHNYGYAVDVDGRDVDSLVSSGLLRKYGFARPLAAEPWHIERAGLSYSAVRAAAGVGLVTLIAVGVWLATKGGANGT